MSDANLSSINYYLKIIIECTFFNFEWIKIYEKLIIHNSQKSTKI